MKPLFPKVKAEPWEETIARASAVLAEMKKPPLSYYAGFFFVNGKKCQRCSERILVEPATISRQNPEGEIWFCVNCGEVDGEGVPTPQSENEPFRTDREEGGPSVDDNTPF